MTIDQNLFIREIPEGYEAVLSRGNPAEDKKRNEESRKSFIQEYGKKEAKKFRWDWYNKYFRGDIERIEIQFKEIDGQYHFIKYETYFPSTYVGEIEKEEIYNADIGIGADSAKKKCLELILNDYAPRSQIKDHDKRFILKLNSKEWEEL